MSLDELSATERELYALIIKNNGELYYKVELIGKLKLMGAVGKLVSKHLVKIERDPKHPIKAMRKKLVLIK